LYTGPVGSANVTQQIHDYNVHIDSNQVFWMIRVPDDAVNVDFRRKGRATLRVPDLEVFDDHDVANSLTYGLGLPGDLGFSFPRIPPVFPVRATVSFEVKWNSVLESAQIRNDSQHFEGLFLQTEATVKWSSQQQGFAFVSEEPNSARNLISVLGRERNGAFFT
jgi:hypothetical protein